MKNMFKISSFSLLLAVVLFSCAKDEHRVVFESSTNPVLTASSTNDMVLNINNKDAVAEVFTWTNPTYRFNTGISSQDVTYTLQFDTAGKNFTSPGKQERSIGTDLSVTLTVKDLNSFLSKMELTAGKTYNAEFRIKSTLVAGTVPLYSNVIKMKITPYLDYAVEPPGTGPNYDDGNLWATGDCFPSPDWANPLPSPYDVSLKFTKIDKLHYVLIATFDHSGGYKLIQAQGVWSTQYHALVANTASGGDFEKKDSDPQFASPGVGTYKIEVNFQTGKYKLTQQ
jgi:starch-binding outer membrane protein SusE/F